MSTSPSPIARAPLFPAGTALVAGGSGGIGSAICLALAEAGSDVVLTYNRNRDAAMAVVAQIEALGRRAEAVQLSLDDAEAVQRVANEVAAAHPDGIHTGVYAVGPFVPQKFMSKVTPEEFKKFLLTDSLVAFHLAHALLPHLRQSKGSLVAVTTTVLSRWANKDGLSAIPKAAVERLWAGIAREEGRFGVRANSVALGIIRAGQFHKAMETGHLNETYLDAMAKNVPLQRTGTAQEVADAAVFLASSRAGYTTGQILHVDGGYAV